MGHLDLSENAVELLKARYLRRNQNGEIIETPEALFERVASAVAQPELLYATASDFRQWRDEFFRMMTRREFLPNSPTLMNAGTPLNQLSACYVLPVGDTIEDIFDAISQMAIIQRSGGGTGFSFSRLRPKGSFLYSTGGSASGPVSFMAIFNCATANIKQGGKRRGANMGVLRVDHPDILDFIRAKQEEGAFENFNLSVMVNDTFMESVRLGEDYDLRHPRDGRVIGRLNAGQVFREIYHAAWKTGDPGLIFSGAVDAGNPTPHLGKIRSTNPCGEIPLLDYESCNLGSINLGRMIDENGENIDWDKLKKTARMGVRFLDNVIDAGQYPVRAIEKMTRGNRKIGLGVMGFADMLIRLGIAYDSKKGAAMASKIMETICREAFRYSLELAEKRGVYPHWKNSVHWKKGLKIRNAARTAVAPTGSISIIAGATPGIEPLFALAYRRTNVLDGRTFQEISPCFRRYVEQKGMDYDRLIEEVREKGSLAALQNVPEEMKKIFTTALEIGVEGHLRIQKAFQRHVDNSVSKTINMPENSRPNAVGDAYWRAWQMGLKGITVYRYGSKSSQVLETEEKSRSLSDSLDNGCQKCPV